MDQIPLITLQKLLKKHVRQEQQYEKFEIYFTEFGNCLCHDIAFQQVVTISCLQTIRCL